jgi:hypothetical protein
VSQDVILFSVVRDDLGEMIGSFVLLPPERLFHDEFMSS